MKNILLIGCKNQEALARGWEKHHIKCRTNGIYIITLYFRHWESIVARYQESDIHVFFLAVENIIQEIMQEYKEWEGLYSEPYLYHILFTCSQEPSMTKQEERLRTLVKNLVRHFEQILELDTVIAVSRNTFPAQELHRGYRRARKLLEQCYFHPEKKLFWDGVLSPKREADLTQLQTMLQKCGQPADFTKVIAVFVENNQDALIDRLVFLKTIELGIVRYRKYCPELVNLEADSYADLSQLLRAINDIFLEAERSGRDNACSFLVKRSLEIMNANLQKKITLEDIYERKPPEKDYLGGYCRSAGHQCRLFQPHIFRGDGGNIFKIPDPAADRPGKAADPDHESQILRDCGEMRIWLPRPL